MLALPPLLPTASRTYDFANEAGFRTALIRYFQQQRTDSTVVDPSGAASAIPGTLVKSISGGTLANTQVTETVGLLTVAEALRVTGTAVLASTLTVGGAGSFLTTLHSAGAVTFDTTLLTSGIATFGSALWAGTDGTLGIGQRTTNRFASFYATTHLWLGTTPTVTIPGGLTGTDTFTGSVSTNLSSHTPNSGFLGWTYADAASSWILTGSDGAQCNASLHGAFVRATAAFGDDNLSWQMDFFRGAVSPGVQTMGLMVWQPTTGTTYQAGEGLQLGIDGASQHFYATLRNSSGTTLNVQDFGAAPTAWTSSQYIRLGLTLAGVTATWWWEPGGGGTRTTIGTYTIPSAYQATFKDGAHKGGGWTGSSNSSSGLIYVGSAVATGTGAQLQADGFAAYVASPTAGSYAVGGGQYIGNHGAAGLTDGYGLYIEDQVGSGTNHALHTGLGLVTLGDAVTMASTLGVTGAVTGSSTFSGTQYTSTIAIGTAPFVVTSTTKVANLDAHYLGATGQDDAFFRSSSNQNAGTLPNARLTGAYTGVTGLGTLTALTVSGQLTSTLATGTAPFIIASTTLVSNLHAASADTSTTQSPGDNTTKIATTAFVTAGIAAGVTGSGTANTLPLWTGTGVLGNSLLSQDAGATTVINSGIENPLGSVYIGDTVANWQSGSRFPNDGSLRNITNFEVVRVGAQPGVKLWRFNGTFTSPTSPVSGNVLGQILFGGWLGGVTAGAQITATAKESWGTGATGTRLDFYTSRLGALVSVAWTMDETGALLSAANNNIGVSGNAASPNNIFARLTTVVGTDPGSVTGTTPLRVGSSSGWSANLAGSIQVGGIIQSTIATGTAPFVVASTTLVANLHAAVADTSTTQTAGNNSTSIATTAYVDRATGTTGNSTAAPHNTTSTTGVMMGLALAYTPTIATKALITISGAWANATLADGVKMQIRYGTGTAPTNSAGTTALTGTAVGSLMTFNKQTVATDMTAFTLCFPITGLTIGTPYWIDMSLGCITGGTASVTTVDAVALETT